MLVEQQLTLDLGGDLARLKDLVERTRRMSRLLTWRRITIRAGRGKALISVYSAPERNAALRRDVCVHPRSKVWLWPYTEKVRVARAQVDELCTERQRHAETRAHVDEFQERKARLEGLILAIEKVHKDWRVPEIAVEDDTPAEAPGLPSKTT